MTTAARTTSEQGAHWYAKDGTPCYEVQRADGSGMRPTTLRDARKLDLLPSVTTVLGVLRKPALEAWKVEQAVLACLTSPKHAGIKCSKCDWNNPHLTRSATTVCERCCAPVVDIESLDDFVTRILHTEKVQDQERDAAAKRGTEIHAAIESYFNGAVLHDGPVWEWIAPTIAFLVSFGYGLDCEKILVSSDGYAGKTDLIQRKINSTIHHIWDFKTTKKLPKSEAWPEHVLQCSAYANAYDQETKGEVKVTTGNIYISTVDKGAFTACEHGMWYDDYFDGFKPLVRHWQWSNNYVP